MADAGWYPDAYDPNMQHYFDGQNWTGQRRPHPPEGTPQEEMDRPPEPVQQEQWNQPQGGQGGQAGHAGEYGVADDQTLRRGDLPGGQYGAQPYQQPQGEQQYAPPAYGDQQYGDQSYGDQQYAQPQQEQYGQPYAQPYGDPHAAGQPGSGSGSKKRRTLLLAGIGVVVIVAGVVTYLVWPSGDDAPTITYQGKSISDAAGTLSKAEDAVKKSVSARHGADNGQTRCYYAKPKKPDAGAKASDVADALRCGPVLFVDGEKTATYLQVPLTAAASGSNVQLSAPDNVQDLQPSALGSDVELVRPDGESAPSGNGGLDVPKPPAGEKDLLTTGALPSTAKPTKLDATMAGKYQRVTLTSAAELDRYGSGDDARSAPSGQKLIAFQIEYGSGDIDDSNPDPAQLVVGDGTPRDIPSADGDNYVIAAIPTDAAVKITIKDSGYDQSLSVPAGKPGSTNLQVLQRQGRTDNTAHSARVPIGLRRGSDRGDAAWIVRLTAASLDFWAPANPSIHAGSPGTALLTLKLTRRFTDESKYFAFNTSLIRLVAGGKTYKARNVLGGNRVSNVFEVPASFRTGTLQVTGKTRVANIDVTITKSASFPIKLKG